MMAMIPNSFLPIHDSRDTVEELCCLYVMGELPREDQARFEEHLRSCDECQRSVQVFESIALFELPAAAALQIGRAHV